ncbi:MAG TPA: DsbA family protein [Solirubrobacteraceae bacterium]|jgi:2-hydroxychromene-2-carboxylate isomerase
MVRSPAPEATFFFDLGSPFAYLASERLHDVLGEQLTWQPISLGALFKLNGRSSWALGEAQQRRRGMAEVERRARLYGLAPLRWPDPWPGHYLMAMRAATYAFSVGCGVRFTQQAFRDSFVRGADLSLPENVLGSARRAGLDSERVRAACEDPQVKLALRAATDAAHRLGVFGVPTVALGRELFWGDDRLEEAAEERRTA